MSSPLFFPDRSARPFLDDIVRTYPFPLALTYERLHAAMDQQQPVEAAWALRDAVECAIKFAGCLAVADFLAHDPERQRAGQVAEMLLTNRGLATGAWVKLLNVALEPVQTQAAPRTLAGMFGVFYEPGRRRLSKSAVLNSIEDDFTAWRNRVFGHGVFRQERDWYARETLAWLPRLHAFLTALQSALAGWRLLAVTADGQEVDWQGCDFTPMHQRHQHDPAGAPLPMFLVGPGSRLPLGPLLSVQRCRHCQEPAAFFFDRQKDVKKTIVLEYLRGHHGEEKDWAAVAELWKLRPTEFEWRRQVYDTAEVVDGEPIRFHEFEKEYERPGYLLDALLAWVRDHVQGYVLLGGRAGIGKSSLVRGLAEMEKTDARVLRYHIQPGRRTECQLFAIELNEQVKEKLGCKTVDLQLKSGTSPEALQEEFADFLTALKQHTGFDTLLIAIDGLDELPEAAATEPLITDLLPAAGQLPEGCFVVLASRPEVRPRVRGCLDRLRQAGPEGWLEMPIEPGSDGNVHLLRAYLARHMPEAFRGPGPINEVIRRSGGVFLYAAHYARALETGVFADTSALPAGEHFYPVFLARLRDRVGPELYQAVYLPLLLYLTAAFEPVTREQLEGWGLPPDRLRVALNDLRDFVHVVRVRLWHEGLNENGEHRYEMAHEDFERFVRGDVELSERLRRCHETMASRALERGRGQWQTFDPADDADLYDLRFARRHATEGRRADWEERLGKDEDYVRGCWGGGRSLFFKSRYHLAAELLAQTAQGFHGLIEQQGRAELSADGAMSLMQWGVTLECGRQLREALAAYEQAIPLFQRLIEREGKDELVNELARAFLNRGTTLMSLGRLEEAAEACERAVSLRHPLVEELGRAELVHDLAAALTAWGTVLTRLGRLEEALAGHQRALELLDRVAEPKGRGEFVDERAYLLSNQGDSLAALGRLDEAVDLYERALAIRRRQVEVEGRRELTPQLAAEWGSRSAALAQLGRLEEALAGYDEAIALYHRLVEQEGRRELIDDFARPLLDRGVVLQLLNRDEEALAEYDRGIALFRRLVEQEGRRELADTLAGALSNQGAVLRQLGRLEEAVAVYDEAIVIRRRLVEQDGRRELIGDLAWVQAGMAKALLWRGARDRAADILRAAIPVLCTEVERTGRADLKSALDFAESVLCEAEEEPSS